MRRRTIGLGLGLLLVGGVSVCFLARHGGGLRERTLEDGSIVTFRGVTYGTTHRMPGGPGWQRLLGRFLPARLASKYGLPVATYNNNTPLMMVWIEYRNPSGANRLAGQPVHYGSMWAPYALTDSAGTHFGSQAPATETKTPEGVLCGFWFGVLPRSSEQFRFREKRRDVLEADPRLRPVGDLTNLLGEIHPIMLTQAGEARARRGAD